MGTPARCTARSKARAKSRCEVNRSGPRLAYRIRMRWTTGAWSPGGWFLATRPDRGQRQQLATGRTDLDLGVHARAHAAVEARRPAAVVLLVLGQRVPPVLPEPLLVQPGVEVVPGQHLQLVALPGGVPVEVDADVRAGLHPALVREVLRPAVEPSAQLPDPVDHR